MQGNTHTEQTRKNVNAEWIIALFFTLPSKVIDKYFMININMEFSFKFWFR